MNEPISYSNLAEFYAADMSACDRSYFEQNPRANYVVRMAHPSDFPNKVPLSEIEGLETAVFNVAPGHRIRVSIYRVMRDAGSLGGYYHKFIIPMQKKLKLTRPPESFANQLSGIGFSTTQRSNIVVRVKGRIDRMIKVVL